MNKNFPEKYRTPKQCREKYINSARFNPDERKVAGWTHEEDVMLFNFYLKEGPKWGLLAKRMPKRYIRLLFRSRNCLKNRFYGILRKIVRKLNGLEATKKTKKRTFRY